MTIQLAVLNGGTLLGTGASTLYTCPLNGRAVVKRAVFTNSGGATVTLTVFRVPSGGSTGPATTIIAAQPLTSGQAYVSQELGNMVLQSGDTIQAQASTAGTVAAFLSGMTA